MKETHCNQCPAKAQEQEMEQELEKLLDERVGEHWKKWGRENLLDHVYRVSWLSESPSDEWTTTTARLVGIFKGQQNRVERTAEYNRRQAAKERRNG